MEADYAEAEAQITIEEREQVQSDTLKLVFSTYFRILKETSDDAMLAIILDGISRFARLINAEFFGDLLEVLREIIEGWDSSTESKSTTEARGNRVRQELVCLNTAFTLLANQGDINIDLSFFINRFYELLPEICLTKGLGVKPSEGERSLIELVVRIVDAILFTPPTAPPPARVFQFYKRILSCSLQMEEKEAMVFLKLLQRIGGRFEKKVEGMWDHEGAGIGEAESGRGVRGWEVSILEKYYTSNVTQMTKSLWKSESKES
jgi:nucleolar complex protein 3